MTGIDGSPLNHIGGIRLHNRPFGLTDKEAEVLRLVDRTRSTGEIAAIVGRSIHTVEAQIKSARRRMDGLDRYRAADMLRRAEHDQTGVNPGTVMSDAHSAGDAGDVGAAPEGGGADADRKSDVIAPSETAEPRRPTNPDDSGTTQQTPIHRTLMTIAATAAAIALLLLSAPQLAKGAQVLAERLLTGSTGSAGAGK